MDYCKDLPRGKTDKPFMLLQGGELTWDCEECGGALAILHRRRERIEKEKKYAL